MIVGPDFVFLHVPRCAGSLMQRVWLPQFGGIYYDHFHGRVPAEGHAHKFTFAIVRNPYDRMMSMWAHWKEVNFMDLPFLKTGDSADCAKQFLLVPEQCNQADFLSLARLDWILHYETLAEEVLNLPFNKARIPLPAAKVNQSIIEWEPMTERFIRAVNASSAADFGKFGYKMRVA
jgi:hypothetical protein